MGRRICRYYLSLVSLLNNDQVPDSVYRRYQKLLVRSYEETGERYGPIVLSNREVAEIWKCDVDAARACLTQMRKLEMIETEQIGRDQRRIKLLVAWRSKGNDRAPETNAPEQCAASTVSAPTTTAQTPPMQAEFEETSCSEGAKNSSTLAVLPNVVVGTYSFFDESISRVRDSRAQEIVSVPTTTISEKGAKNSSTLEKVRTLEEIERIKNALWDLNIRDMHAVDVILGEIPEMFLGRPRDFSHVTAEFVEDWVLHRRLTAKRGSDDLLGDGDQFEYALDGGFYRMRIREKRESPYQMSYQQRADYRAKWDEANDDNVEPVDSDIYDPDMRDAEIAVGESSLCGDEKSVALIETQLPYRVDGTQEIWASTLAELKLQMTKATFDTWVKPTRALGFDDTTGDLVIAVHSPYAMEWLEHRLHTTVQRTVTGFAGRAVTVRYEVARF